MQEPLVQLADRIPWQDLENDLSKFYFHTGTPSMPIRLMAGLIILKRLYNFDDESIVDQCVQNHYYQYFCGEAEFQQRFPCDSSDLVNFRKRIGEEGVELIFKMSIDVKKVGANMKNEGEESNAVAKLQSNRLSDM